jgi:hypothetical protein
VPEKGGKVSVMGALRGMVLSFHHIPADYFAGGGVGKVAARVAVG